MIHLDATLGQQFFYVSVGQSCSAGTSAVRRELLDRILIVHRRHLEAVLTEYERTSTTIAPTAHCTKQHHSSHSPCPRHRPIFTFDGAIGSTD